MTIIQYDKPKLTLRMLRALTLKSGGHQKRDNGLCVMEAVAWYAGTGHTDHPDCVSPVIAIFLRSWNDSLPTDEDRARLLKRYVPLVVGTATNAKDEQERAWLATDWLARECAPAFLRLAALVEQAEILEGLAPILSAKDAGKAQPSLNEARKESAAAGDAAWAAAWAAARAAARDAAWDAARGAARAAARSAAGGAARAKLAPAVAELQASAIALYDVLITGEWPTAA